MSLLALVLAMALTDLPPSDRFEASAARRPLCVEAFHDGPFVENVTIEQEGHR